MSLLDARLETTGEGPKVYPKWMRGCFDHFGYSDEGDWLRDLIAYQCYLAINVRSCPRSLLRCMETDLLVNSWDEAADELPRRLSDCDWKLPATKKQEKKQKAPSPKRRRSLDGWAEESIKRRKEELEEELRCTFESLKSSYRDSASTVVAIKTPLKSTEYEAITPENNQDAWSRYWQQRAESSARKARVGDAKYWQSPVAVCDLTCDEVFTVEDTPPPPERERDWVREIAEAKYFRDMAEAESRVERANRLKKAASCAVEAIKKQIINNVSTKDWTQEEHDLRCERLATLLGSEEERSREAEDALCRLDAIRMKREEEESIAALGRTDEEAIAYERATRGGEDGDLFTFSAY